MKDTILEMSGYQWRSKRAMVTLECKVGRGESPVSEWCSESGPKTGGTGLRDRKRIREAGIQTQHAETRTPLECETGEN